jgi:hypothetical protein
MGYLKSLIPTRFYYNQTTRTLNSLSFSKIILRITGKRKNWGSKAIPVARPHILVYMFINMGYLTAERMCYYVWWRERKIMIETPDFKSREILGLLQIQQIPRLITEYFPTKLFVSRSYLNSIGVMLCNH